ncbi:MAG: dynamin family protein [Alphaproteobacteria bacterium]|nr:dynamin family protein [Alphaproteobacteria bacterium]
MGESALLEEGRPKTAAITRAPGGAETNQHTGIGRDLEKLRRDLLQMTDRLDQLVEPAGRSLVAEAGRLLGQQVCRIAVVGQIKSGKSTFVNACIGAPSLLPTDVNPWTTAVTNLRFQQRRQGDPSATFQFFNEDEWQHIANGGGLLRELTERLVPGFEPQLLREQINSLRHRASARLGPKLDELMGQSHSYDELNADVLKRYVCAGDNAPVTQPGTSAGDVSQTGLYSDITRSADVHCSGGPFAFPSTIIDTPGTNDPFLLRDEITRRSLESADLYVIVLTARQPLSDADVALLRILRGLHKERLVIFINRIDDLADISHDQEQVRGYVEKRIGREFPDSNIPVIVGSARWANAALAPPGAAQPFDRRSLAYFVETGLMRREDLVRAAQPDGPQRRDLQEALLISSGIPAVHNAIDALMKESRSAHVLRQVSQCYGELARASENAIQGELAQMSELQASASSTARQADTELPKLDAELRQLGEVQGIIETSAASIEEQMREIVTEEITRLREVLNREVDRYADEETHVLIDTLRRGRGPREWRCEADGLRKRLADIFVMGFNHATGRIVNLQKRVAPELYQLMSMIVPGAQPPHEPDPRAFPMPSPNLSSLSTAVVLDLETTWWAAVFKRSPSPEQRGEEVGALIRSEFSNVLDDLTGKAESALTGYGGTMTKWSFGICNSIIEALRRRREELRASYQELAHQAGGEASPEAVSRRTEDIAKLRAQLADAASICSRLDEIIEALSPGHRNLDR